MSKQTRLAFIFLCYLERIHELACRTTTQRQRAEKMNGTRVEMTDSNSRISEPAAHGQTVSRHAPVYTVPRRSFSAVEHPMLVQDIDKGIATFGRKFNFQEVLQLEDSRAAIPLYLRPDNPSVRPLTSHNAATHNVLLKVTVPKRTGRKRKRGSNEPFEGPVAAGGDRPVEAVTNGHGVIDPALGDDAVHSSSFLNPAQGRAKGAAHEAAQHTTNMSRSGLDRPAVLRRKLQDNVGKYTVEPVGIVYNTHRFRGLSDFQYSMSGSNFMTTFVGQVMPGSISDMRQYSIKTGTAQPPNIDLMPPPFFAPHGMPNVYNYSQNPFVRGSDGANVPTYDNPPEFILPSSSESEEDSDASDDSVEFNKVVNTSMRGAAPGYFIRYNDFPAPLQPRMPPDETDPHVKAVMAELKAAMEDRPAWTRRSMFNRLSSAVSSFPSLVTLSSTVSSTPDISSGVAHGEIHSSSTALTPGFRQNYESTKLSSSSFTSVRWEMWVVPGRAFEEKKFLLSAVASVGTGGAWMTALIDPEATSSTARVSARTEKSGKSATSRTPCSRNSSMKPYPTRRATSRRVDGTRPSSGVWRKPS